MNEYNSDLVIYLDNNATTRVDDRVLEVMMPFLKGEFANANSSHYFGVKAHEAVKLARNQVAELIGADPYELIFTSGSTEAINIAIKGIADSYQNKGRHIITSVTEHPSVLDTCRYLQRKGFEVTYLPVGSNGLIDLQELEQNLRDDTILVSIMYVNNETGIIHPIREISDLVHSAGALFMSDTTQAVGKIPINVDELNIDLLCMSGHKIYSPKGVGALYVRQRKNRITIPALFHGGGHEKGLRSGTLNVPGIVALGKACSIGKEEMSANELKTRELRDFLENELLKIENVYINGDKDQRIFNTSNLLIKGVDSDALILSLSNPNDTTNIIAVSNGSACTSIAIEPSHVLTSMNLSEGDAFSSIRFSLGKYNTMEEIKIVVEQVNYNIKRLRSMI